MSEAPNVKETNGAVIDTDEETGLETINQYIVTKEIGFGAFATVKLCYERGKPQILYAMKVIKKVVKRMLGPPGRMKKPTNGLFFFFFFFPGTSITVSL